MKTLASSFADPQDMADYAESGDLGNGDNGVGCWGDVTAQTETPMCALPPEDIIERWGSMHARDAKGRLVRVTALKTGLSVECLLADRMLPRAKITNGAGIDLNPAAALALGLQPPFLVLAEWTWGE